MEDLGERIAGLVELAFPELATRNNGPIQALLADMYMDVLSNREWHGDVLREEPSILVAAIEAARNSERLWDRIRGSMARDPRRTKIMKKKEQVWVWDLKEEVEENWELEADLNRREWDPRYRFYRPMSDRYGLVCWTCKYSGHRYQDCPTKWGGDPTVRWQIRAQISVVCDGRRP